MKLYDTTSPQPISFGEGNKYQMTKTVYPFAETSPEVKETTYPKVETELEATESLYPKAETEYLLTETSSEATETVYPTTETSYPLKYWQNEGKEGGFEEILTGADSKIEKIKRLIASINFQQSS